MASLTPTQEKLGSLLCLLVQFKNNEPRMIKLMDKIALLRVDLGTLKTVEPPPGKTVKAFTKHASSEVASRAKRIVKAWKAMVVNTSGGGGGGSGSPSTGATTSSRKKKSAVPDPPYLERQNSSTLMVAPIGGASTTSATGATFTAPTLGELCIRRLANTLGRNSGQFVLPGVPLTFYCKIVEHAAKISHLSAVLLRALEQADPARVCEATDSHWRELFLRDFKGHGGKPTPPHTWREHYDANPRAHWNHELRVKKAGKVLRKSYKAERKTKKDRRCVQVDAEHHRNSRDVGTARDKSATSSSSSSSSSSGGSVLMNKVRAEARSLAKAFSAQPMAASSSARKIGGKVKEGQGGLKKKGGRSRLGAATTMPSMTALGGGGGGKRKRSPSDSSSGVGDRRTAAVTAERNPKEWRRVKAIVAANTSETLKGSKRVATGDSSKAFPSAAPNISVPRRAGHH
eukprot:g2637.t1